MINMSVGWYIGGIMAGGAVCYIIGYFCGRIDGKGR